jgi:hypothetical protein
MKRHWWLFIFIILLTYKTEETERLDADSYHVNYPLVNFTKYVSIWEQQKLVCSIDIQRILRIDFVEENKP